MTELTRRTFLTTTGSTGAFLALGGVGTAVAREGASTREKTIVDVAAADSELTTLVAAVQAAGLVPVLSGNRQLTVFAPTDDAFDDAGFDASTIGSVPAETLVDILTYHVSPGRRYAASVLEATRLPTLAGRDIAVDGTVLNDGEAELVVADTDIEAANGVIHKIDGVLGL